MTITEKTVAGRLVLALDAHGGDFGPAVTIPAALDILLSQPDLEIIICGVAEELTPVLSQFESDRTFRHCFQRLRVVTATHALASDARPVAALRRGKGSSLSGLLAKMGGLLARSSMKRTLARFEPSKHNGAPLLGLQGVVVKSHGNANREAMGHAIREAVVEAQRRVPQLIQSMINDFSIEAG